MSVGIPKTWVDMAAATAAPAKGKGCKQRGEEAIGIKVNWTGQPTAVAITIEARLTESGDWTQVPTSAPITDAPGDADADFEYSIAKGYYGIIRSSLDTMTAGTNPTCTVTFVFGGG